MMDLDATRIRAVVRKELRDYRRKRSIVVTMIVLPLLFLLQPVIAIFLAPPSASGSALGKSLALPLLYLLLIPVITPSTLAAYAVVGEREQGTLEPLLTTPIRRQEFILGKAAAVMIPTLALSYAVIGLFLAAVWLFANPVVAMAGAPGNQGYWLLPSTPPPTPSKVPAPPGCSAGFVCGHVTAIGDSVMLDAQPSLQADIPGIDVEAAVSRQWDDGVVLAQEMKAAGTLGSIVVRNIERLFLKRGYR